MKHIIIHYAYFILILMLIFLQPSCVHKKDIIKEALHINTIKKETAIAILETSIIPPPITIWVHGTILFYKSFYQNIFKKQSGLFLAKDLPFNHYFHHFVTFSHDFFLLILNIISLFSIEISK